MLIPITTYYYNQTKNEYLPTDGLMIINLDDVSTIYIHKKADHLVNLTLKSMPSQPYLIGRGDLVKFPFRINSERNEMLDYLDKNE